MLSSNPIFLIRTISDILDSKRARARLARVAHEHKMRELSGLSCDSRLAQKSPRHNGLNYNQMRTRMKLDCSTRCDHLFINGRAQDDLQSSWEPSKIGSALPIFSTLAQREASNHE